MNLPGNLHFRLVSDLIMSVKPGIKTELARYINPVDLVSGLLMTLMALNVKLYV